MAKIKPVIDRYGNKKALVNVRVNGQRIRQMLDVDEAKRLLAESKKVEQARLIGLMVQPNLQGRSKLRDAIHEYKADVLDKRESKMSRDNAVSYLTSVYDLLHMDLGLVHLDEVREEHLLQWREKLLKSVKPRTANSRIAAVAAFLNWCVRKRMITENPARFIKPLKFVGKRRLVWTMEQVAQVLTHAREPYRAYLEVVYRTGARPKEMRNLERGSLNFTAGVITFRCGKNAGSGERQFPMDEKLRLVLLEVIRRLPADETHVFPFTESAVQQYFEGLRRRLRFEEPIQIYGLRHTFATGLIAGGADVFTVRKLMGHASLRTTENYVQTNMTLMRETIEKLGRQRETAGTVAKFGQI